MLKKISVGQCYSHLYFARGEKYETPGEQSPNKSVLLMLYTRVSKLPSVGRQPVYSTASELRMIFAS